MRISFCSLVVIFLLLSCGTYASAQTNVPSTFTTNLSLGSSGAQVTTLQQILNRDPDTRVANTGPGSPGEETSYFGSLTSDAVKRFQEKYASAILAPAGLAQGNGFVGSYTRAKLNALSASTTASTPLSASSAASSTATSTAVSTTTSIPQNPNQKNLDAFMAALDRIAAKQGLSSTALAAIKEQVVKETATTTDLRATFLNMVQEKSKPAPQNGSPIGKVLSIVEQVFDNIFMPKRALAGVGVPFGGALLDAFYCDESETWLIILEPLPPSYAVLLTYVPESELFLSYNIPLTDWLLGTYEPDMGVCIVGAGPASIDIPSEGLIMPEVGSSPL